MKSLKILTFLVALTLIVRMVANGALSGSAHDFSGDAWNSANSKCGPCHTPHNALSAVAPLWAHTASAGGWTMYPNGGTLQATIPGAPTDISAACLSCHDGTVALDSYVGVASPTATLIGAVRASADVTGAGVGTLATSHPISFTYDNALYLTDTTLHDPAVTPAAQALLFNNKVECSSCHDTHNTTPIAGQKLLRVTLVGSALCTTCHNK